MQNQDSIKKKSRDTKLYILRSAIINGWNTQVVNILWEEHDGQFIFKGNLLSRPPKSGELSHNWVLKNYKYHKPKLYARLFD